jgi:hypothetical protein
VFRSGREPFRALSPLICGLQGFTADDSRSRHLSFDICCTQLFCLSPIKSAGKNLRAPPRCDANIGSWLGSSPPQILFRSFKQGLPFKGQISGRSTQNKKKWPIKEVLSGRIHVSWRSASNLNWFTRTTVKGQFYRQGPPSSRLATTQKAVKNACHPFFLTTSPLNGFCYSVFHAPTCSLSPSEKKLKRARRFETVPLSIRNLTSWTRPGFNNFP